MDASPVGQGGLFLLQFIAGLISFVLILRFVMRATYVDWRHPIVTFIAKVTNPLCAPFNKLIPLQGRWDLAALFTALVIQALYIYLMGVLTDRSYSIPFISVMSIHEILYQLTDMIFWLIIIQVVLSWVSAGYNPNTAIFDQMTAPILKPFRAMIPPIGGMDLSPIAAIVAIKLIQIIIVGSIGQVARTLMGLG